jgi:hypothetical protein
MTNHHVKAADRVFDDAIALHEMWPDVPVRDALTVLLIAALRDIANRVDAT